MRQWMRNLLPPPLTSAKTPGGKHPASSWGYALLAAAALLLFAAAILYAATSASLALSSAMKNAGRAAKTAPQTATAFQAPSSFDAQNYLFAPEAGIVTLKVPMSRERFSGFITTPADWPRWYCQSDKNRGFWLWFLGDKKPIWFPPGDTRDLGERRGIFRVSGEGNLFVSIRKF